MPHMLGTPNIILHMRPHNHVFPMRADNCRSYTAGAINQHRVYVSA